MRLMEEFGFKNLAEVELLDDNTGAIKLAHNRRFQPKTKHFDLRHHYIRQVLPQENAKLEHLSTDKMFADMLIKGVPRVKDEFCSKKVRSKNIETTKRIRESVRV